MLAFTAGPILRRASQYLDSGKCVRLAIRMGHGMVASLWQTSDRGNARAGDILSISRLPALIVSLMLVICGQYNLQRMPKAQVQDSPTAKSPSGRETEKITLRIQCAHCLRERHVIYDNQGHPAYDSGDKFLVQSAPFRK